MRLIAEAYDLIRTRAGRSAAEIAGIFMAWNSSDLESFLIGITAEVLAQADAGTGRALVDDRRGARPLRAGFPTDRIEGVEGRSLRRTHGRRARPGGRTLPSWRAARAYAEQPLLGMEDAPTRQGSQGQGLRADETVHAPAVQRLPERVRLIDTTGTGMRSIGFLDADGRGRRPGASAS